MKNDILIKDLINNAEIVYDESLNVDLVKLSIMYSDKYRTLYVFGELRGEPNDSGIEVTVSFVTDEGTYIRGDDSDSFYATFPGIQSFNCNIRLDDALIRCQRLKINIERKYFYARDK